MLLFSYRCWEVIDALAETVFSSENFLDIDHGTLDMIVSRESLVCDEIVLFNACLRWCESKLSRLQLNSTDPAEKRKVLGHIFDQIRFTQIKVSSRIAR